MGSNTRHCSYPGVEQRHRVYAGLSHLVPAISLFSASRALRGYIIIEDIHSPGCCLCSCFHIIQRYPRHGAPAAESG